jgi:hypothetical protein
MPSRRYSALQAGFGGQTERIAHIFRLIEPAGFERSRCAKNSWALSDFDLSPELMRSFSACIDSTTGRTARRCGAVPGGARSMLRTQNANGRTCWTRDLKPREDIGPLRNHHGVTHLSAMAGDLLQHEDIDKGVVPVIIQRALTRYGTDDGGTPPPLGGRSGVIPLAEEQCRHDRPLYRRAHRWS